MRKLGYSPAKIRSEAMKILRADKEYRKAVAKNTLEYKKDIKNIINETTKAAYKAGDDIVAKALTLFGVMGEFDNMSGALKLLSKYNPDLVPIITDDLPFDNCIKGFDRKNYPDAIKITVKIGEE